MLRVIFRERLNQRGSSILSVLTAVTLLGISSAGLYQYMQNFEKTTVSTVEKATIDPLLKELAVNNMKSLLLEKGVSASGGAGQNNNGICAFLEPPTVISGVQALKMSFSQTSTLSNARWQVFFPKTEWKKEPISSCQNMKKGALQESPWVKCFKYLGDYRSNSSDTIYILAEIVPLVMDPESKPPIGPLKNLAEKVDPKKVIFQLMVTSALKPAIEVLPETAGTAENEDSEEQEEDVETYIGYSSDLVWANEVGECIKNTPNGQTIVKMSATGIGSNLENFVLNNPSFSKNLECEKELVWDELNNDVIRAGNREGDLTLSSVINLNARIACTRNTYKCPTELKTGSLGANKEYDPLEFSIGVKNYNSNHINLKKINFTLINKNKSELDNKQDGVLQYATVTAVSGSNSEYQDTRYIGEDNPFYIVKGSQTVSVRAENSAKYCHNICQNYSHEDMGSYVFPSIKLQNARGSCEYSKNFAKDNANRVQCVVCHTKSCHRYGLGTFGPLYTEKLSLDTKNSNETLIYGLNSEATDSQIPECTATNAYQEKRKLPEKAKSSGNQDKQRCMGMALKVSNINSFKDLQNKEYEAVSCDTILPVLCFVNGQYLPALKLNPNNLNRGTQLATAKFKDAEKVCFELGREVGSSHKLATLFDTFYGTEIKNRSGSFLKGTIDSLPSLSAEDFDIFRKNNHKYSFINNAVRGMFLAPISYGTLEHFTRESKQIIKKLTTSSYTRIWTALEWDDGGSLVASPPWALVAKNHPFALFQNRDKEGTTQSDAIGNRLTLLKDTNDFSAHSRYYALTYNIRWKGLVPQQETARHKFVCQNKSSGEFFISSASDSLSKGHKKCANEGGLFIPPESGLDWAKLMLELNPNDDHYPFPHPGVTIRDADLRLDMKFGKRSLIFSKNVPHPMAWVALEQVTTHSISTKPLAEDFRIYFESINSNSIFRKNRDDVKSKLKNGEYNNVVINDAGVTQQADINNYSNYRLICVRKNEQGEYIPERLLPLNSQSCKGSDEEILDVKSKSYLFKPTSYKYVSYWLKNIMTGYPQTSNLKITLSPSTLRNAIAEQERAAEEEASSEEEGTPQ